MELQETPKWAMGRELRAIKTQTLFVSIVLFWRDIVPDLGFATEKSVFESATKTS
jgi:hypothetical protein